MIDLWSLLKFQYLRWEDAMSVRDDSSRRWLFSSIMKMYYMMSINKCDGLFQHRDLSIIKTFFFKVNWHNLFELNCLKFFAISFLNPSLQIMKLLIIHQIKIVLIKHSFFFYQQQSNVPNERKTIITKILIDRFYLKQLLLWNGT